MLWNAKMSGPELKRKAGPASRTLSLQQQPARPLRGGLIMLCSAVRPVCLSLSGKRARADHDDRVVGS